MRLKQLTLGLLGLAAAVALVPQAGSVAHADGPKQFQGGGKPGKKPNAAGQASKKPNRSPATIRISPQMQASAQAAQARRAASGQRMTPPRTSARGVTFGTTGVSGAQNSRRWSTETNRPPRRETVRGERTVTKGDGSGAGKNKQLRTAKPESSPTPSAGSRASVASERLPRIRRNRRGEASGQNFTLPNNAAPQGMVYRALAGSRPNITVAAPGSQPLPPAGAPPPLPTGPAPRSTLQKPIDGRPRNVKSARPPRG